MHIFQNKNSNLGFFFSFGFAALQLCVAVACLTTVAATPLYFVCSRLLNKIVMPKTCVIFPSCISTILVVVMREIIYSIYQLYLF